MFHLKMYPKDILCQFLIGKIIVNVFSKGGNMRCQFLIGKIIVTALLIFSNLPPLVSIPHRKDNRYSYLAKSIYLKVSIPHRKDNRRL